MNDVIPVEIINNFFDINPDNLPAETGSVIMSAGPIDDGEHPPGSAIINATNSLSLAINQPNHMIGNRMVAIGKNIRITGDNSLAIGQDLEVSEECVIVIGKKNHRLWFDSEGEMYFRFHDRDIKIEEIVTKIEKLELIIEEMKEKLHQVWSAPGMPGMFEAKTNFVSNQEENDL